MSEEDDTMPEPEYLDKVIDILDTNSELIDKTDRRQAAWLNNYETVKCGYDKLCDEFADKIIEFNNTTDKMQTDLANLSKEFINLTRTSPGELKELKDISTSAMNLAKEIKKVEELAPLYLKLKKLRRAISVEKKKATVNLDVITDLRNKLSVIEEVYESF